MVYIKLRARSVTQIFDLCEIRLPLHTQKPKNQNCHVVKRSMYPKAFELNFTGVSSEIYDNLPLYHTNILSKCQADCMRCSQGPTKKGERISECKIADGYDFGYPLCCETPVWNGIRFALDKPEDEIPAGKLDSSHHTQNQSKNWSALITSSSPFQRNNKTCSSFRTTQSLYPN